MTPAAGTLFGLDGRIALVTADWERPWPTPWLPPAPT
jgi:hypothetical protein